MTTTSTAWDQALRDFADHLDRSGTGKPDTHARYRLRVRTIAQGVTSGPWTLTSDELARWLGDQNWSAATRRNSLVALRRFYTWAILAGRVERSPLVGLPDGTPPRPGPKRHTLRDAWAAAIPDYLASLRAGGRRPGTLALRRQHLNQLSQHFANPWAVTPADLVVYLAREDWSPEYRRAMRNSLRLFYRWATVTERITRDPAQELATVKVPRTLPRPLPTDVLADALDTADARVRLALELGAYAGLRRAEVAQLQVADYLGSRLLVRGKGGHERIVPIHPSLGLALTAELERRQRDGITTPWFFPSPRGGHLTARHLGRLVTAALGGTWIPHTLRHRFATQAYSAQRDLRAVQELLGHTRPETTARYAAVRADALTAAVAGVGLVR